MIKINNTKTKPSHTKNNKTTGYTYSDKSKNQPELIPIFNAIHKLLSVYEKGTIKKRGGKDGQVALVSEKELIIEGRKRSEIHFAAALIQKGYVGFYFMPIYAQTQMKKVFKPELLKCLKGKSCFHIKQNDSVLLAQIKEALVIGYKMYKEKGWV